MNFLAFVLKVIRGDQYHSHVCVLNFKLVPAGEWLSLETRFEKTITYPGWAEKKISVLTLLKTTASCLELYYFLYIVQIIQI